MAKLNLQISDDINKKKIPKKYFFKKCLYLIFKKFKIKKYEITIRIVNISEIKKMNKIYRKKNFPTNVLSFPFQNKFYKKIFFLGDIIICNKIIEIEAIKFKKKLISHWAHISIHGCLHLLGYNHNNDYDKKKMESIEIKIMQTLGYNNPYILK